MNTPPVDGIRVAAEDLRRLVVDIFDAVPIPAEHARLIAEQLVKTDLRGVVSHGVTSVERYVRAFQEGRTNPRPQIRVLREGPVTAALSGDGGLGIVVATRAMHMAMERARDLGAGMVTTTYHDHIGSAGKYVRMALQQDLIGTSFSGRSAPPAAGREGTIQSSVQGDPPMAFGMPGGSEQPPLVLDMGTSMAHGRRFEDMPDVFFKSIGLSNVANIMSGTLGGQMLPEFDRRTVQYRSADQSGFFMALDVERFVPLPAFTGDVDHLTSEMSRAQPFPGCERAELPGGPEWRRERDYAREGIPVSQKSVDSLAGLAGEFGLTVPW